jgi:hypothetical protein
VAPAGLCPPSSPTPCAAGCGTILVTRRKYCSVACRDSATGAPWTWADRHGVWSDHAPKSKRNMRYAARHPEAVAAHRAVERALAAGRLVRPEECECCGAPGDDPVVGAIEAHHHLGYAPEHHLDVQWLCRLCHDTAP